MKAHDPVAMERFPRGRATWTLSCANRPEEVADDADALVLVTEWPQYRELDWDDLLPRMRQAIILDGRNALDRVRLGKSRFRYVGIAG